MAREVIVRMTDDLDRSKVADVVRVIGWDGFDYVIDLTNEHDKQLLEALQPFLDAAHEKLKQPKGRAKPDAPARPYTPVIAGKAERKQIREWARANGHKCGDQGIIPARVMEAWETAHAP